MYVPLELIILIPVYIIIRRVMNFVLISYMARKRRIPRSEARDGFYSPSSYRTRWFAEAAWALLSLVVAGCIVEVLYWYTST